MVRMPHAGGQETQSQPQPAAGDAVHRMIHNRQYPAALEDQDLGEEEEEVEPHGHHHLHAEEDDDVGGVEGDDDDMGDGDIDDDDDDDEDSEEIFGLRSHHQQRHHHLVGNNVSSNSNLISNPFQSHHHHIASMMRDHHHMSSNHRSAASAMNEETAAASASNAAASVTVSHKPSSNSSAKQVMTSLITPESIAATPSNPEPAAAGAATIDCSSLTQVMNLAAGLVHASPPPPPPSSSNATAITSHHYPPTTTNSSSSSLTRSRSEYTVGSSVSNKHPGLSRGSMGCSAAAAAVASATTPSASHPLIQVIRDTVYSSFLYNKQKMQERLLPLLPVTASSNDKTLRQQSSAPTTPTTASSSNLTSLGFLLKTSDPVMESKVRSLRCARSHLKQVLRVTSGPLMTSLNQISHSFSQLDQLIKELNGNKLEFSSGSSSVMASCLKSNAGNSNSSLDQQIRDVASSLRNISSEAEKMKSGINFFNNNLQVNLCLSLVVVH